MKAEAERLHGEQVATRLRRAASPRPPLGRRQARVRRGVERLVWTEYDPDDSGEEAYGDSLVEDLDELAQAETFLKADPDALIAQLAAELGLVAPAPLELMNSKAFPGGAVAQIYRPA